MGRIQYFTETLAVFGSIPYHHSPKIFPVRDDFPTERWKQNVRGMH